MTDLNKLTAARIIAIHNALLPSTPLAMSTKKADAITAATTATVAPKQIAAALGDTPFNVRQALRAARREEKVDHIMKQRWTLTPAIVIELFPALVKGDKAETTTVTPDEVQGPPIPTELLAVA